MVNERTAMTHDIKSEARIKITWGKRSIRFHDNLEISELQSCWWLGYCVRGLPQRLRGLLLSFSSDHLIIIIFIIYCLSWSLLSSSWSPSPAPPWRPPPRQPSLSATARANGRPYWWRKNKWQVDKNLVILSHFYPLHLDAPSFCRLVQNGLRRLLL